MNILQKISTDHYKEIKYTLHPRKTEMENIDKMINCGDPSFGGTMYSCPHCGYLKYVSFHCLVSEGGLSDNNFWKTVNHFNYNYLRNAFRTALLNKMEAKIGPSFTTAMKIMLT